jgi:ABC-type uncharacterized transport system involved in gliding motility auxiliary subunit
MAGENKSRTFRYGSNAAVGVLLLAGILIVTNLLSLRYRARHDTTLESAFSLSDQTTTLLDSLKHDVQVIAFFRQQDRPPFEEMLKNYGYVNRRFSYRFVDPDRSPVEAREAKVRSYGTSLVRSGEREERITGTDEKALTNAIARAVSQRRKVIYFLAGHGEIRLRDYERQGYSKALNFLREGNYVVRDSLLLAVERSVPSDCDLLVVAGPRNAFLGAEVDSIHSYLRGGGAGLFLLDPGVTTGLAPVLKEWAISVNDDYVVDGSGMGRLFGLDYSMPVAAEYANHPVTLKHKGKMTFYMLARSVTRDREAPGMNVVELVKTSGGAWREMDGLDSRPQFDKGRDVQGPVSLAMAVWANPMRTRVRPDGVAQEHTHIVVFGDSDFATNQFFDIQGNGDLFLNSVNWLLQERDQISIRPKAPAYRPITLRRSDSGRIFWVSLVLLPLLPLLAGTLVWWRRR